MNRTALHEQDCDWIASEWIAKNSAPCRDHKGKGCPACELRLAALFLRLVLEENADIKKKLHDLQIANAAATRAYRASLKVVRPLLRLDSQ